MIPVYAFLEGDSLGLLIFTYEDDTVAEVARKVQASARCRVAPVNEERLAVYFQDEKLDPGLTLGETRVTPLSIIEVRKIVTRWPDAA